MTDVFSFPDEKFLLVGKVAKPHGLRGEVKIHAFSDDGSTLLHYSEIVLVDSRGRLSPVQRVAKSRLQGKSVVIKFDSVNDRNSAESLYGMGVLIDKKALGKTDDDEYYWYQFYDLPVHTREGRFLGTITSIFSNGAQDVLVIENGDNELLVPVIKSTIIEHTDKGVTIAPPPGLLELYSGSEE